MAYIEDNAFHRCSALTSIVVESGNTNYDSRENCNAIIETASNTLIQGCINTVIPGTVTSIGCYAFSDTQWFRSWYGREPRGLVYHDNILWGYKEDKPTGSIEINDGTRLIAGDAFYFCVDLTSVTIPNSVIGIGEFAFNWCSGLTTVTIPNSVTTIGNSAFENCRSLTSVTIGSSVTTIGERAFFDCEGLTTVTIPNSVTTIGESAFSGTRLASVTIGSGVTSIGDKAFLCPLKSIISQIEEPFPISTVIWPGPSWSAMLYVPVGTKAKYEATTGWDAFKNDDRIREFANATVTLSKDIETFIYGLPLDFTTPVSGLKAYTVTAVDGAKAVLCEVTGTVPAATGLILKGTAGQTYKIPYTLEKANSVSNKLSGALTGSLLIEGNGLSYILQDGKFVKASTGLLKAGKAYLRLDAALAREIIEIDDVVTGIISAGGEASIVDEYYDLQGRRVEYPAKGLYIKNGKKIIVK